MTDNTGQNESRELEGGEIIYLVKEPDKNWRIKSYECHQSVVLGGRVFRWLQGLPAKWEGQEFETADEAVTFAQTEIQEGKVPSSRRSQQ
ncbi:MAG: hypothetical protein ACNS63_00290 [Candidatus Nitrospinota bacterium M3_3B_026]